MPSEGGLCRGSCPCCWAGEGGGDVLGTCLHPLLAFSKGWPRRESLSALPGSWGGG